MIRNKSKSTIVLEWMGRRQELPAGWSANLDPESESYLLLKYPDVLESDVKENIVEKLLAKKIEKKTEEKIEEVVKKEKTKRVKRTKKAKK